MRYMISSSNDGSKVAITDLSSNNTTEVSSGMTESGLHITANYNTGIAISCINNKYPISSSGVNYTLLDRRMSNYNGEQIVTEEWSSLSDSTDISAKTTIDWTKGLNITEWIEEIADKYHYAIDNPSSFYYEYRVLGFDNEGIIQSSNSSCPIFMDSYNGDIYTYNLVNFSLIGNTRITSYVDGVWNDQDIKSSAIVNRPILYLAKLSSNNILEDVLLNKYNLSNIINNMSDHPLKYYGSGNGTAYYLYPSYCTKDYIYMYLSIYNDESSIISINKSDSSVSLVSSESKFRYCI